MGTFEQIGRSVDQKVDSTQKAISDTYANTRNNAVELRNALSSRSEIVMQSISNRATTTIARANEFVSDRVNSGLDAIAKASSSVQAFSGEIQAGINQTLRSAGANAELASRIIIGSVLRVQDNIARVAYDQSKQAVVFVTKQGERVSVTINQVRNKSQEQVNALVGEMIVIQQQANNYMNNQINKSIRLSIQTKNSIANTLTSAGANALNAAKIVIGGLNELKNDVATVTYEAGQQSVQFITNSGMKISISIKNAASLTESQLHQQIQLSIARSKHITL